MSKARIINFKPTPRPKSNLIPFLSVVLIGALIMSMCNRTATAQGTKTTTDTIPAKRYHYFLKYTNVSADQYLYINRVKDSIMEAYKEEMGNKTLRRYYELENFLRDRVRVDSVEIREPKK